MVHGTGVDIVEISRIRKAVDSWGGRFLTRVFLPEEIEYAQKHTIPYQHYAGRFAAKEAVYKALGDKKLSWKDFLITNTSGGKPVCHIKGLKSGLKVHLSISHCKYYAVAQAVVEAK